MVRPCRMVLALLVLLATHRPSSSGTSAETETETGGDAAAVAANFTGNETHVLRILEKRFSRFFISSARRHAAVVRVLALLDDSGCVCCLGKFSGRSKRFLLFTRDSGKRYSYNAVVWCTFVDFFLFCFPSRNYKSYEHLSNYF